MPRKILSTETGKEFGIWIFRGIKLREGIEQMGINEWHANVIIELLRITRDGYVSGVSSVVKKVTGKEPISFSTFAKDFGNVLT